MWSHCWVCQIPSCYKRTNIIFVNLLFLGVFTKWVLQKKILLNWTSRFTIWWRIWHQYWQTLACTFMTENCKLSFWADQYELVTHEWVHIESQLCIFFFVKIRCRVELQCKAVSLWMELTSKWMRYQSLFNSCRFFFLTDHQRGLA